ncbi:MAG: nucleotidyltransferase [Ruminococcaceae bacterium]|nr:nucleotidyltransferase [Oscillospiraceae bacterium]
MTAIILAAGLGSRYGGLKQLDPVGPNGEFIIDYSVYDCIRAGFDRIVFIIKEENLEVFEETIGSRIKGDVKIEYAFQNMNDLPDGFSCPVDRAKPWGTAHALRACRNIVDDKFVIFNADDFYGRESFENMFKSLDAVDSKTYSMPGYTLANTLSDNGHVARGVCVTENGMIKHIREIKQIMRIDGIVKYEDNGEWKEIDENSPVSMNFWGFTPDIFQYLEDEFAEFLKNPDTNLLKDEFYIPSVIDNGVSAGDFQCKVIDTPAKWMGVTYRTDKPAFLDFLNAKIAAGEYPENLWGV